MNYFACLHKQPDSVALKEADYYKLPNGIFGVSLETSAQFVAKTITMRDLTKIMLSFES